VGFDGQVEDEVAIAFASTFYTALASGKDVRNAYQIACVAVGSPGSAGARVHIRRAAGAQAPRLIRQKAQEAITSRRSTARGVPQLLAKFRLRAGSPVYDWDADGYEIELYLKNSPSSVREVRYQLHPSYVKPLRVARNRSKSFRENITSYGDYKLRASFITKDRRGAKTSTLLTARLSQALERGYPGKMTRSVAAAIKEIRQN
jgi:hypothetical protein